MYDTLQLDLLHGGLVDSIQLVSGHTYDRPPACLIATVAIITETNQAVTRAQSQQVSQYLISVHCKNPERRLEPRSGNS